jgi:NMD protein affecting ribosome stability and mRNA decay
MTTAERPTLEDEMSTQKQQRRVHTHHAERVHVLLQRAGVPYEIERQVCTSCHRVLDEKPVKRAAA